MHEREDRVWTTPSLTLPRHQLVRAETSHGLCQQPQYIALTMGPVGDLWGLQCWLRLPQISVRADGWIWRRKAAAPISMYQLGLVVGQTELDSSTCWCSRVRMGVEQAWLGHRTCQITWEPCMGVKQAGLGCKIHKWESVGLGCHIPWW